MTFNLSSRGKWFSVKKEQNQAFDSAVAPFDFSYLLFSEQPEQPLSEIISGRNNVFYQPLSSRCIWLSSQQALPYTDRLHHSGAAQWELCKAPASIANKPQLVSFDMDSTLIVEEVIDELAREAGCYDEVSAVTEEAMRGELDFNQSLIKRVSLITDLEQRRMQSVAERLSLSPGAKTLVNYFKQQGIKTAILSGGFDFFAKQIGAILGVDFIHANALEISSSKLTGKVIPPIVNAEKKAELLRYMASENKIDLKRTVAIGDGANDLLVMAESSMGIAWHAKPKVSAQADLAITCSGLDVISWIWD